MHIKPKDIVQTMLYLIGFLTLMVLAAYLETAPMAVILGLWIVAALVLILIVTWFILVAKERERENARPKLKMMQNGRWVEVASIEGTSLIKALPESDSPRRPISIFDQNEHKEQA